MALVLGSISTALAWAVTTFLPPTVYNWKLLSTMTSLTAILQVPIFLLYESVSSCDCALAPAIISEMSNIVVGAFVFATEPLC